MKRFDPGIPRKMYWSDEISEELRCPSCRAELEKEHHTYLLVLRSRGDYHPFVMGNEAGAFCPNCPIVVLDREALNPTLEQTIGMTRSRASGRLEYTVLGIINMNAIPKEKAHLPLGGDDNPLPLVRFIDSSEPGQAKRANRHQKRRRKRKHAR
jgi:hypothetical protein